MSRERILNAVKHVLAWASPSPDYQLIGQARENMPDSKVRQAQIAVGKADYLPPLRRLQFIYSPRDGLRALLDEPGQIPPRETCIAGVMQ